MHGVRRPRPVTTTEADQNPAALGTPDRERRPWALMVVLSVAQFMVILDATVVNVALPSIARSLSFPAGGLQWVVTAYVLASGGLVLLGGRAADLAGRRRTFLAGLALFTAAESSAERALRGQNKPCQWRWCACTLLCAARVQRKHQQDGGDHQSEDSSWLAPVGPPVSGLMADNTPDWMRRT